MMIDANEIKRLLLAHREEVERWLALDLTAAVDLLNQVAAGGLAGQQDDDALYEAVDAAHDLLMRALFSSAWNGDSVDPVFWGTEMGQVITAARLWLDCDSLITATEAAMILRGSAETRDIVNVARLVRIGKLTRYVDSDERNPQHAGRFSRAQVEALRDG